MKSLLRWAGSKRRLAKLLAGKVKARMTPDCRYIEPFAGGASVFFEMEYPNTVLVDSCKPLISFYEAVAREPALVLSELEKLKQLTIGEESYNLVKKSWSSDDYGPAFAAKFLYMNRMGFNGLFRLNKSGGYNVPFGKKTSLVLPTDEELFKASKLLSSATIYYRDCGLIISAAHEGDVMYLDPPYLNTFDKYGGNSFTYDDHVKLADLLMKAAKRGVHIIASNVDVPEVRKLYEDWATIESVSVFHSIGASTESRKKTAEVIITSLPQFGSPKQLNLPEMG